MSAQNSQKPLPRHLNDFLDWLDIEKGLSSKTQENYARFLAVFFRWLEDYSLQKIKPHELTGELVRQYRLHLSRKKSLKKSTQNYYLSALRSLLTYFTEKDIASLPPEKIKLARMKDDRKVRFLSEESLRTFFSAPDVSTFHGLRDRAIMETLFSTGMRIAELISLNREHLKIPRKPTKVVEISIRGKGGRIRAVYFSRHALEWLKKYLDERKDTHSALFITYRSEKRKIGARRITPRTIQARFKRYAIGSGIPLTTTPHVMRHCLATSLLSQGVDIRTVQEFLGHKDISATQIYAHVTNKRLKETHEKFLGSVLGE